jgi:hypothetical protein
VVHAFGDDAVAHTGHTVDVAGMHLGSRERGLPSAGGTGGQAGRQGRGWGGPGRHRPPHPARPPARQALPAQLTAATARHTLPARQPGRHSPHSWQQPGPASPPLGWRTRGAAPARAAAGGSRPSGRAPWQRPRRLHDTMPPCTHWCV